MDPFSNREKQKHYILWIVGVFAFLVVSIWGWSKVHDIASRKVQKLVNKVQTKSGIPVSIGHWRIGFGGANFEDIVIGENSLAVISEVSADVSLNPFSKYFGELQSVTIHRVELRINSEQFLAKKRALGLRGYHKSKPKRTYKQNILLDDFFKIIPVRRSLVLKSGGLVLLDDNGDSILAVKGLNVLIDKRSKKIAFKAPAIRVLDGGAERGISGKLTYQKKSKRYELSLKQRTNNKAPNSLLASYAPAQNSFKVDFKINKLPRFVNSILKHKNYSIPTGRISGNVLAKKEFSAWKFSSNLKSRALRLKAPFISQNSVGPIPLNFKGAGSIDFNNKTFALHEGSFKLMRRFKRKLYAKANPSFHFNGSWSNDKSISIRGNLKLPSTRCQSILDISPKGFLPALAEFKLSGRVAANINYRFNTETPEEFYYHVNRQRFTCNVQNVPYAYSPEHLNGPFTVSREVSKAEEPLEIAMSPLSRSFSHFDTISPNVNKAFVTSEDAGFWKHNGIDSFAIENALRTNLSESRIAIGGSTITMQTVKNLFLNHRRTLSRKMQEIFLAWHLENVVDKKRIIELYMNVAEFGPGIYGVTEAAEHYFDKSPFDLNIRESAFLAALLPSPVKRYQNFCNQTPSEGFRAIVDQLLKRMMTLGKIDGERYLNAMNNTLEFNEQARAGSTACTKSSDINENSSKEPILQR